MSRKRSVIVGLVGVNLGLLGWLILSLSPTPAAVAQTPGRPQDFSMFTCQIHEDYEALAIVNNVQGAMYVFVPRDTPAGPRLTFTESRDLAHDFGRR